MGESTSLYVSEVIDITTKKCTKCFLGKEAIKAMFKNLNIFENIMLSPCPENCKYRGNDE